VTYCAVESIQETLHSIKLYAQQLKLHPWNWRKTVYTSIVFW